MMYPWQCRQGSSAVSYAVADRKFRRTVRQDNGSQIAEAAMILPILFMLLLSIYWFGRAFMIYGAINHAARQGASTAAVPECANCTSPCPSNINSQLPCDQNVVDAVNSVLTAAHIDPTQTQAFTPVPQPQACPVGPMPGGCNFSATGTSPSGLVTVCRNVVLSQTNTSAVTSAPVCGVIVSFQYPYQFVLPLASMSNQKILLKAQVEMRGED